MNPQLEKLCEQFPEFDADYTPPWGLPSAQDFGRLAGQFACQFPASFIDFQTNYAARLPVPDNGFRWANDGLEPYLSLESTIQSARDWGVPVRYVAFWDDEGNFCCFDSAASNANGELPIVFWDHDAPSDDLRHEWPGFVDWLRNGLRRMRQ